MATSDACMHTNQPTHPPQLDNVNSMRRRGQRGAQGHDDVKRVGMDKKTLP